MSDQTTTKVTIGGEYLELPEIMTFDVLERVWPAVKALAEAPDDVARTSASLAVVAAILLPSRPDLNVPTLKKRLRVNPLHGVDERIAVFLGVNDLLIRSGLVERLPDDKKAGNVAAPGEPGQLVTGTGNQTSNTS